MWKMSKSLTACVLAAAWWGIFYPELCFLPETCEIVWDVDGSDADEEIQEAADDTQNCGQKIDAAAVWRASGNEIVISSRLLEWCEEKLFAEETQKKTAGR